MYLSITKIYQNITDSLFNDQKYIQIIASSSNSEYYEDCRNLNN